MSSRVKWSIVAAAALALVAVTATTAARRGARAVEVRIEPVQRRDLVASVTASGQVQPHSKVDIASDISGRIVRLAVQEGQVVARGQFLLQIDPSQYQAAVQRAEAALASARAQAAQAAASLLQSQRNFERSAAMKKANPALVSDEQLEQLRTAADVNRAIAEAAGHSVDQAAAALRDAQTALGKTTIVAPMSGRVTRLAVQQGETAVPGTFNRDAATLLTISDMSVLETKVKVDETDVARIAVGDSAIVQIDAFPDTTFLGRVVKISNSSVRALTGATVDQAVDYEVTIQLLNPPSDTRPDFSATARIVTDSRSRVLSVPIIALTVRENESLAAGDTAVATLGRSPQAKQVGKRDIEGVFVVGADHKVSFRPVRVGIAGDKYFEVRAGLRENERIVGGSYQAIRELKDGTLVREAPAKPGQKSPLSKS